MIYDLRIRVVSNQIEQLGPIGSNQNHLIPPVIINGVFPLVDQKKLFFYRTLSYFAWLLKRKKAVHDSQWSKSTETSKVYHKNLY